MTGRHPDQPVTMPLGRQSWSPTVFLHYPCDVEGIARLLPPGLSPQLFEGQAWLSVTPLVMRRVRPPLLPPMPGWSTFPEVNIRTYVSAPDGHDGLWFFRLDCPRRLMVWGLNPLGLAYRYRKAEFAHEAGVVNFCFHGEHEHTLDARMGDPIKEPTARDVFLTGRWNAFTVRFNRLLRFPIAHEPWPLYTATATGSMLTVPHDLGFPVLTDQPDIQYSPGVDVRLGSPRPTTRREIPRIGA